MQRHGAVMPGPHGDALLVQQLGDVVGVNVLQGEGRQPVAVFQGGAVERQARHFGQAIQRVGGDGPLVILDAIHAQPAQIIDGCTQPDRFRDGRGARFKLVREIVPVAFFERDALDHVSAAHVRRHGFQQRALAVQDTDPGRSGHLVPGERHEIDVQRLHVHFQVRDALRAVQHDQCARRVGLRDHPFHRVDGAQHVADVHHADHLHAALAQKARVSVLIQPPIGRDRDVADREALFFGENLPGDDVAVMLHHAEHHHVAGAEVRAAPRRHHEIHALGGVAGVEDLAARLGVDERLHLVARGLVLRRGALAQHVDTPVHVGVAGLVVAAHGVDHLARLLAARRRVQKDDALAGVDFLVQDREVGADSVQVERGGMFGHASSLNFTVQPAHRQA